jgi:hypothetical protein
MPRVAPETLRNTQIILKKEKVFTLSRLVSLLECSSRAAQTKLQQWRTYTSYNQNSKYYTMPHIPQFNVHGLWHYKGKYFSKYGNLKKTVVHLIRKSKSGLSGNQLGKLIGLPPQSFLHHFREVAGIRRIKQEGVFVYFSEEPDQHQQQVQKRLVAVSFPGKSLADAQAITILVALIKHHDITVDDILALPEVKAFKLSSKVIRGFLEHHGLQKKIVDTRP